MPASGRCCLWCIRGGSSLRLTFIPLCFLSQDIIDAKKSRSVQKKIEARANQSKIDPHVADASVTGRIMARLSSRPGQSGRADGYILEGKELDFYMKKTAHKK